ncbi:MAG: 2-C-methyl-D-erythritol 2,4-cyclodiphosphate synthase [Actinomycetota bacterium]|nr:2-C-methyl-D-erythritol 2,4-cyclodiphosphate synthase [Actinomycetota bacterium]
MRAGLGFDVHKFKKGRKLILGGVNIGYPEGLDGYSDADVLLHALMDAILGGCGLGDIGVHFPDNDIKYKDISSMVLLEEVRKKMEEKNFKIVNIDATLIMQEPKVSGYIPQMRKNIAGVLKISEKDINIKATTTEGLGFCGRKEGIAAECVVMLG